MPHAGLRDIFRMKWTHALADDAQIVCRDTQMLGQKCQVAGIRAGGAVVRGEGREGISQCYHDKSVSKMRHNETYMSQKVLTMSRLSRDRRSFVPFKQILIQDFMLQLLRF